MSISNILENYRTFIKKVDNFCNNISNMYSEYIYCKKGCDECCSLFSIYSVEAVNIVYDLNNKNIINKIKKTNNIDKCPFLCNKECLIYNNRPIICRTHGFPIFTVQEGNEILDYCYVNFKGINSFPENFIISLDRLNETLMAINSVFISEFSKTVTNIPDRISMSDIILINRFIKLKR